jgi:hypothetical protein
MPGTGYGSGMIELLRSNDPVLLSFAEALLKEAGIRYQVADQNMSVMEGTIGILPRRVLVARDRHEEARRILTEAGLERELS